MVGGSTRYWQRRSAMRRELLVARRSGESWAIVVENGRPVELRVEAPGASRSGQIVKVAVAKIVPGIQSAFVDLGGGRQGFLHASDLP